MTTSSNPFRQLSHCPTEAGRRGAEAAVRRLARRSDGTFDLPLLGGKRVACRRTETGFQIGQRRISLKTVRRACNLLFSVRKVRLSRLTGVVENSSAIAALICHFLEDQVVAVREEGWVLCLVERPRAAAEKATACRVELVAGSDPGRLVEAIPESSLASQTFLFHVMSGGSNLTGWELSNRPIPTLISLASYLEKRNSLQTPRAQRIIPEKCQPLVLDSGRLTWMKKGQAEMARVDLTPLLLDVGRRLGAKVIIAGDVPMEPHLLARVGLSPDEALAITREANDQLYRADWGGIKGYVIQGYEESQYVESALRALDSPLVDEVRAGRAVWVIGSVCMAPVRKVLRIGELMRRLLPGTIHMLGQGRPTVIRALREMGITWADSGTAAGYASRMKWLFPLGGDFGWRRLTDGRRLPPEVYGFLVRQNIEVMELCVAGACS